ncbi:hypothetical protein KSP40_PGU002698 [Platanthera guangdongensis]|uniref:Uncharacterized protein n=1 Tax=Platanthera guangdongensis TaxID=2320717 RepID=A0ABR2MHM5_9ASPA
MDVTMRRSSYLMRLILSLGKHLHASKSRILSARSRQHVETINRSEIDTPIHDFSICTCHSTTRSNIEEPQPKPAVRLSYPSRLSALSAWSSALFIRIPIRNKKPLFLRLDVVRWKAKGLSWLGPSSSRPSAAAPESRLPISRSPSSSSSSSPPPPPPAQIQITIRCKMLRSVAEILKNNGLATEKRILTSTIGTKDEIKGRLIRKAKQVQQNSLSASNFAQTLQLPVVPETLVFQ